MTDDKPAPYYNRAEWEKKQLAKYGITTGLAYGQFLDPPKPPKPKPTLTERLVTAISKNHGLSAVADELAADPTLDLTDDTIEKLRGRLCDEIEDRRQLSAAFKDVLDRRAES